MSTGDCRMPCPQVGNPMSPQCRGPIGDAGSWFHAPTGGACVVPAARVDPGLGSETTAITAAAAPAFSSSLRVSRTFGCSVVMIWPPFRPTSSEPSADGLMARVVDDTPNPPQLVPLQLLPGDDSGPPRDERASPERDEFPFPTIERSGPSRHAGTLADEPQTGMRYAPGQTATPGGRIGRRLLRRVGSGWS